MLYDHSINALFLMIGHNLKVNSILAHFLAWAFAALTLAPAALKPALAARN